MSKGKFEKTNNLDNLNFGDVVPKIDIPPKHEFEVFKKNISSLIGLDLFNYKSNQMERRITSLMNRNNLYKLSEYFNLLKSNPDKLKEFTNMLTINVTEFFRNEDKFSELEAKFLPELVSKFGSSLKIWSAGCSCGAEIYSIAMILDKMNILDKCKLIASDFDVNIIKRAKEGIYSRFEISEDIYNKYSKYFIPVDNRDERFQINRNISSKVNFERKDLLNSKFDSGFHLILCRNVVIYFTEDAKDQLYAGFYNSLVKGGILFIGSTERINSYREIGYDLASSFFYKKPE